VHALVRRLLGLGIFATLAANVAHGLGHGLVGAAVATRPAVAFVGSSELQPIERQVRCAGRHRVRPDNLEWRPTDD